MLFEHIELSPRGMPTWQKPYAPCGAVQASVTDAAGAQKMTLTAALGRACIPSTLGVAGLARHDRATVDDVRGEVVTRVVAGVAGDRTLRHQRHLPAGARFQLAICLDATIRTWRRSRGQPSGRATGAYVVKLSVDGPGVGSEAPGTVIRSLRGTNRRRHSRLGNAAAYPVVD